MTVRIPAAPRLRAELEAIASVELASVLSSWPELDAVGAEHLRTYLAAELADGGLLSVSKARDAGHTIGLERAEARRVLDKIQREA